MRLSQHTPTAHNIIYPSIQRTFVDSFLDRGIKWIQIDHIPWDENPLVIWELDAIQTSKKKCSKSKTHEWLYNGKIYHRDVLNNIWQKIEGHITWIGIYNPQTNIIDFTATEPK